MYRACEINIYYRDGCERDAGPWRRYIYKLVIAYALAAHINRQRHVIATIIIIIIIIFTIGIIIIIIIIIIATVAGCAHSSVLLQRLDLPPRAVRISYVVVLHTTIPHKDHVV